MEGVTSRYVVHHIKKRENERREGEEVFTTPQKKKEEHNRVSLFVPLCVFLCLVISFFFKFQIHSFSFPACFLFLFFLQQYTQNKNHYRKYTFNNVYILTMNHYFNSHIHHHILNSYNCRGWYTAHSHQANIFPCHIVISSHHTCILSLSSFPNLTKLNLWRGVCECWRQNEEIGLLGSSLSLAGPTDYHT